MTDTVNVPRNPTPEMLDAAVNRAGYTEYGPLVPESLIPEIWRAMLAVAPAPASDGLQGFADFIADEIPHLGLTNSKTELVKAAFRSLICRYNAKHKGPQS